MDSRIVYFDSKYDSGWINPNFSQIIAVFFRERGFQIRSAVHLRTFVKSCIEGAIENPIIVFSMDKVPDTVLDDNDASCLVRQYLDCGGRIVWIGDIPFWHVGKNQCGLPPDEKARAEQNYMSGAYLQVLGVNPVIRTVSCELVKINWEGVSFGLRHGWSGVRPIEVATKWGRNWFFKSKENMQSVLRKNQHLLRRRPVGHVSKDEGIVILGKSQYLGGRPVIMLKKKRLIRGAEVSSTPSVSLEINDLPEGSQT